jgi:hypothetical protein
VKIVSNASVLIGLSSIGRLSLLQERFPQGILIPEAVRREVIDEGDWGTFIKISIRDRKNPLNRRVKAQSSKGKEQRVTEPCFQPGGLQAGGKGRCMKCAEADFIGQRKRQ